MCFTTTVLCAVFFFPPLFLSSRVLREGSTSSCSPCLIAFFFPPLPSFSAQEHLDRFSRLLFLLTTGTTFGVCPPFAHQKVTKREERGGKKKRGKTKDMRENRGEREYKKAAALYWRINIGTL